MRNLWTVIFLLSIANSLYSADIKRSDSIDIKQTIVYFDITDFNAKNITAHANLLIESKINGQNQVLFDLEGLQVDSVLWNGNQAIFTHTGALLTVNTPTTFNQTDTAVLDLYYRGQPLQDPTWGGFYFVGNYGFQMGVGFQAQPHSVGRYWHPCFDNFVERSPYEFFITTTSAHMGVANGIFKDSTLLSNGNIRWHYNLEEAIPSYLAAIAVSDYTWVKKSLSGKSGITPAWIAAPPVDTNKVNGSFANLQSSFSMLENNFGTHSFSKVGYTLVPFSAGAMEHATNIHIGSAFIDGSLNYETLIAHELAHHWWGDLVTCQTAGDMWLNEGWASYAEHLHMEYTYGQEAFRDALAADHYAVLSQAHYRDDGYKALSPMDSLHTYGPTVYNKGADVIQSLRSYLGDSLFFAGTTAFLNANKFKDINSADLRDYLSTTSGKSLMDFFDDWVFQPGFPHFSIDSTQVIPIGNQFETTVYLRHRKHQANHYYKDVPIEIAFYDDMFMKHIYQLTFSGRCMSLKVNLPFNPLIIAIDPNEKIADATTADDFVINKVGFTNLAHSKTKLFIQQLNNTNDSSLIRIEHNWIPPDRFSVNPMNDYVLNNQRYWRVSGINLQNASGYIEFPYDGTSSDYFIDSSWIIGSELNIRLFYRKDASQNWSFADDSLRAYNPTDKKGNVLLKKIEAGEYCFGIRRPGYTDPLTSDIPLGPCNAVTAIDQQLLLEGKFTVYPNPNNGTISITSASGKFTGQLMLFDLQGKKVFERLITIDQTENNVDIQHLPNGMYVLKLSNSKSLFVQKVQIMK